MNDDLRRTIGAILVIVGWIGVGFLAIVAGSALLDN